MDDLTAFLRARLAEDEEAASRALRMPRHRRLALWLRRLGRRMKP